MRILLKDGVRYYYHTYESESELEELVKKYSEVIFGSDSLYFEKTKIESKAGIGSIPDGFALLLEQNKWIVVEVELSTHSLYSHIVPQLTKFYNAIKNYETKKKLIDIFYNEIKENFQLEYKLKSLKIKKETYKILTDTINKDPNITVIIDKKTKELDEICKSLPFNIKVLTFKTFHRENSNVPIYIIDTFEDYLDKVSVMPVKKSIQNIEKKGLSRWQQLVLERLPEGKFTLNDIYKFENEFRQYFPGNKDIRSTIRFTLQKLRDIGLVENVRRGVWRKIHFD